MATISLSIPVVGQPDTTEDVKVQNNFTAIQNAINGGLDPTNITAALAQSATVNQSGQAVKGATSIAATESRSNVAYGTLTTPDQVQNVVLPVNGLIAVWYQATWQESVAKAARAAIFIGANQVQIAEAATPQTEAATTNAAGAGSNATLFSSTMGLASTTILGYTGDVTTGQIVGFAGVGATVAFDINGTILTTTAPTAGPCYIFAAAGTYTVSVQYKASSGSVTASNRKLWVQALSFA